jgi:hypothetical protein
MENHWHRAAEKRWITIEQLDKVIFDSRVETEARRPRPRRARASSPCRRPAINPLAINLKEESTSHRHLTIRLFE